jgi:hypothetical protein
MKKSSTVAAASNKNFERKLTIGLDLGDRSRARKLSVGFLYAGESRNVAKSLCLSEDTPES